MTLVILIFLPWLDPRFKYILYKKQPNNNNNNSNNNFFVFNKKNKIYLRIKYAL